MKNFLNSLYEGLIAWSEMIHAYRQSSAGKYHYWK